MNKKLLLHICCAPDASVPVPDLLSEGWDVVGFFYGSNIHPLSEYKLRLEALYKLTAHTGINCDVMSYDPEEWLEEVTGLEHEPEGGRRCERCFMAQFEAGALAARRLGCDNFCTTLTISPHKNVALINSLGEKIAGLHGLTWQSRIWRKNNGFLRSIRASRELGLYRQNYCGCVFSQSQSHRESVSQGHQE